MNVKGQANAVVVTIFVSIILLAVVPLALSLTSRAFSSGLSEVKGIYRRVELYSSKSVNELNLAAYYDELSQEIEIFADATKVGQEIGVRDLLILYRCTEDYEGVPGSLASVLAIEPNINIAEIEPGQRYHIKIQNIPNKLMCSKGLEIKGLYLVSSQGSVLPIKIYIRQVDLPETAEQYIQMRGAATRSINIIPLKVEQDKKIWDTAQILYDNGFIAAEVVKDSIGNIIRVTQSSDDSAIRSMGMKGGSQSSSMIWQLQRHTMPMKITTISRSSTSSFTINLWIGYDPRNPGRYNVLLSTSSININGSSACPSSSTHVRIKLYGFRSSDYRGILRIGNNWITTPSQDVADYTFTSTSSIYIYGAADRLEVWCRVQGSVSGYDPYIMFMNTNGITGSTGILFTSIDRLYGSRSSRNDGVDALLDFSSKPLSLIYRRLTLDNTNYSSVAIYVNYRFHDNEGSDADGITEDRPIMVVGLIDETGNVVSYRSFTFRELTRYEDTYPPTAQAQSASIFVPLPSPSTYGVKRFYVFLLIQDPYHYNGNLDDLDFTLFIESLVVVPFS